MSSYQGPFDWMLDPRLQSRGIISPQTAQLAQQRGVIAPNPSIGLVGGYNPPMSPIEQWWRSTSVRPPAPPVGYAPEVQALRSLVQKPAQAAQPQQQVDFFGEPKPPEDDFASTISQVVQPPQKKGSGAVGQLRKGVAMQEHGLMSGAEAEASESAELGEMYGKQMAEEQKAENTYASVERRRGMAMQLADHNIKAAYAESELMDKYPGITVEEARHYQSVLDSPNTAPEQKLRAQAALKKAQEIDPERVFGDSTGRKVMAAIGMALGAYGAALARTPNYAMEIIQNAIEQDIAAQREKFASKRDGARAMRAEARAAKEEVRQTFADERSELDFQTARRWRQFARLVEQTAVKYQGADAKAKALQMHGAALQNAANLESTILAREGEIELQRMAAEAKAVPRAQKPTEAQAQLGAAMQNLDELIGLRKKYQSEHFGGPVQGRMEALASSLKFALAKLHGQGALQAPDREIVEEMLGDPAGFGWQLEKLQTAKRILERYKSAGAGEAPPEKTAQEIGAEYID